MAGYNKGDTYEEVIFGLLKEKEFIIPNSTRGGAGNTADIKILHNFQSSNLEVKLNLKADYGQKMLKWNNDWNWCVDDSITKFYTEIGILEIIEQKVIIPNRYTIPKEEITIEQKKQDQRLFESRVEININTLYDFYANKNCYYIQVGGYGFYHLEKDVLKLGTSRFDCKMELRMRAKTIHSTPIWNYGFYAVLKVNTKDKPQKSLYDIEEKDGRIFPPLI